MTLNIVQLESLQCQTEVACLQIVDVFMKDDIARLLVRGALLLLQYDSLATQLCGTLNL